MSFAEDTWMVVGMVHKLALRVWYDDLCTSSLPIAVVVKFPRHPIPCVGLESVLATASGRSKSIDPLSTVHSTRCSNANAE